MPTPKIDQLQAMQFFRVNNTIPEADARVPGAVYLVRNSADNTMHFEAVSFNDVNVVVKSATGGADEIVVVESVDNLPGKENADPEAGAPAKDKLYLVILDEGTPEESTQVYRWTGVDAAYVQIFKADRTDEALKLSSPRKIGFTEASDGVFEVTFDGSADVAGVFTLKNFEDLTAGTYSNVDVDSKGRVTGIRAIEIQDIPGTPVTDPAW